MKSNSKYKIEFAGLKIGSHQFNFNADKRFFDRFNFSDFNDVHVNIDIDLTKKSTLLELEFVLKGVVNVNCDLIVKESVALNSSCVHKSGVFVKEETQEYIKITTYNNC